MAMRDIRRLPFGRIGDGNIHIILNQPPGTDRDEITRYKSAIELELMRRLKAALDPLGIMNPGKVV